MLNQDKYLSFLIQQAQRGRKNPFLELVELYKEDVYRLSLKLSGDTKSAQEITYKVFEKVWNFIKLLNDETPFELWLHGLVISIALADFRSTIGKTTKTKKKKDVETTEIICSSEGDEVFLSLDSLTRIILILHDSEGYSLEDIATIIDEKDISIIKNHLELGRKKVLDKQTFELLNSLSPSEWKSLIIDFDNWSLNEIEEKNFTQRLKLIYNYRKSLLGFWELNKAENYFLENLKKLLFEEGEKLVEEKRQKKIQNYDPKKIINKREKKRKQRIINEASFSKKIKTRQELANAIKQSRTKNNSKKYLSAIGIVAVVAAVILYRNSIPPTWKVTSHSGTFYIDQKVEIKNIEAGDILETKNDGILSFKIGDNTNLTLYKNTKAIVKINNSNSSVLHLGYGKIALKSRKNSRHLIVSTKKFKAIDGGSFSIIEINRAGMGEVKVKKGRLFVDIKNNKLPVFKNYIYTVGDIAPHFANTSKRFLNALKQIKVPIKYDAVLKQLLLSSTENDALTLWCLLNNSKQGYMPFVFEKLNSLFPIIGDVTKSGIMNKDKRMMNTWLEDIEWQLQ